ncbi:hypothetical protein GCM10027425_11730 [Alteromonas gracilis]
MSRQHHRPTLPGAGLFDAVEGGPDPAVLREAAEQCATALVRGTGAGDAALVQRLVTLAETEGLETLAELWSGSPTDSVAGALWRLYLLRSFVHASPERAAREFAAGRDSSPVAEVVAGVADPPGPDEVRQLVDRVLAGVVESDFADVLFRAAAFAHVVAVGRASLPGAPGSGEGPDDASATRLQALAVQLEHAGRLELEGRL